MAKDFLRVRSGVGLKPNTAPSDPDNGDLYYDSGTDQFQFRQGGIWTGLGSGGSTATPIWTKYTVAHTALQTAALTNNVTLLSLPLKGMIQQIVIKQSTQFAGSGITGYTVSVGIGSNATKYTTTFNVAQAVSDTARSITQANDIESFSGSTNILLTATSIGANLSSSTAGSVDIWVMTSVLP